MNLNHPLTLRPPPITPANITLFHYARQYNFIFDVHPKQEESTKREPHTPAKTILL